MYPVFETVNAALLQDTVLVVPPYPYSIEQDCHDVPLEDCWAARPQLFFTYHLSPKGGRMPKTSYHKTGPDDLRYNLVFFSTFEELKLPITGPMEDAGVVKLYEPSRHSVSTWPRLRTWWAESPSYPAFWMAMLHQLSLTSTAGTRVHVSLQDVQEAAAEDGR
jgi:hypothetical protein